MYNEQWTEIYHTGVKGQKWGKRRYQNPDGTLTPEGRIHYGYKEHKVINYLTVNPKSSTGHLTKYGMKNYRLNYGAQRFWDKFNIVNSKARKAAWDKNTRYSKVKKDLKRNEQYNKETARVMAERRHRMIREGLPKILAWGAAASISGNIASRHGATMVNKVLQGEKIPLENIAGASMGTAAAIVAMIMSHKESKKYNKEYEEQIRQDMYNRIKKK